MNYQTPPPGAYYHFASASPSPRGPHDYYSPRSGAPPRTHSRHQSHDYSYASPTSSAFPSPRYSSKGHYATAPGFSSPRANAEYVSARGIRPERASRYSSWSSPKTREFPSYRASYEESDEDEYIVQDGYVYIIPGRRKTTYYSSSRGQGTDRWFSQGHAFNYDRCDTPIIINEHDTPRYDRYERERFDDTPRRSRVRRSSTSTPQRPATARPTSSRKKPQPEIRKATEADAREHKIPPGYSLKNWDPTEEPITLLGSVFDANSLGKWIYDWTVYHHGPATPISDMSGELWLLLIQLAGKMKRAEECIPRIRQPKNQELMDDFVVSGERLIDKLKKLLKACETPMLRAGRKQGQEGAQLGKNAGVEFVRSIFGRDRHLEQTEKFMASARLWNLRFDANCEEILRCPTL